MDNIRVGAFTRVEYYVDRSLYDLIRKDKESLKTLDWFASVSDRYPSLVTNIVVFFLFLFGRTYFILGLGTLTAYLAAFHYSLKESAVTNETVGTLMKLHFKLQSNVLEDVFLMFFSLIWFHTFKPYFVALSIKGACFFLIDVFLRDKKTALNNLIAGTLALPLQAEKENHGF